MEPVVEARQDLAARDRVRGEITLLVEALPAPPHPAKRRTAQDLRPRRPYPSRGRHRRKKKPSSAWRGSWASPKSDLYRELQRERARPQDRFTMNARPGLLPAPHSASIRDGQDRGKAPLNLVEQVEARRHTQIGRQQIGISFRNSFSAKAPSLEHFLIGVECFERAQPGCPLGRVP